MSITPTPESRGRLVNLKTNLKSLKFGMDRPAGGSSNQPYIVEDIPGGTGPLREGMPLQSGPDFILRDGFLAPIKAFKDISRLAQMFIDVKSPRGLFFTLKQNLLSRTSVKTQASFGFGYLGGAMNQGAYLPIGTLLDAGLGWAGIHLNKNGINPVGSLGGPAGMNRGIDNPEVTDGMGGIPGQGSGGLNLYSSVVKNSQEVGSNRLYNLQNFIQRGVSTDDDLFDGLELNTLLGAKFKINRGATEENRDTPILYSYGGGPGSILGIGRTNIFKYRPTYNVIRNYQILSTSFPRYSGVQPSGMSPLLFGDALRRYQLSNRVNEGGSFRNFTNFVINNSLLQKEEFSNPSKPTVSRIIHKSPNYTTQNKAQRLAMGDPGRAITYATEINGDKIRNVFDYGIPAYEMEALDKITALKMYEGETANSELPIKDLVQFHIAVINNGPSEGKNATYLHFRAYINGFKDNYSATWNDVQYVGRGNKFLNYSGYQRDISMGFTIMATSKKELIPMFTKLNFLASSLAPDYTSAGIMRGNMVRMTVGGYLYEVPGVLTSINYSIPDDTTWEIAINAEGAEDNTVKELPHRIEVSLAFTPVENFLPSRQKLLYNDKGELDPNIGSEQFISLKNKNSNNYQGDAGLEKYEYPYNVEDKETTDE